MVNFINQLFQEYYGKEYLAVKECLDIDFPSKREIKKIAMHYYKLYMGGVERVISLLTPMFLEMGYEVVILVEEVKKELDYKLPDGVEIFKIPCKKECIQANDYTKRAQTIKDIIEEKGIDVVCYHEASSNFLFYDLLVYKMCATKFILLKHEYLTQYMLHMNDTIYNQKAIFQYVDKLIVLSTAEKAFWNSLGIDAKCIYNPIGDYVSGNLNKKRGNVIVWIGRLDNKHKQYLDIVFIMKQVIKKVPSAILKIYGDEWDLNAIELLKKRIQEEGLQNNIEYCGYVRENMAKVYDEASVHLVTSAYESFGMTIYESKVNGVPLVLYKMPYLELLKDEKGYIAVDNDDKWAAAEAVIRILTDSTLQLKMAEEAKASGVAFRSKDIRVDWTGVFKSLQLPDERAQVTDVYEYQAIHDMLEAMIYHYHKGCLNRSIYEKELRTTLQNTREELAREKLKSKVLVGLQKNSLPIVIYPYGKIGKRVKEILNQDLNISEAFVVDNNYCSTNIIVKTVEELNEEKCSDYLFLICSNSKKYYDEIRDCLKGIVPEENIVDLFGEE